MHVEHPNGVTEATWLYILRWFFTGAISTAAAGYAWLFFPY